MECSALIIGIIYDMTAAQRGPDMIPGTRVRPSRVPPGWPAAVGTVLHPGLWAQLLRLLRLLRRLPRTHDILVQWDADVSPVWCDPTELRAVPDQPAGRVR